MYAMKNEIDRKLEVMNSPALKKLYDDSIRDIKDALSIISRNPDEDDILKAEIILKNRIRKHNSLSWSR